MSSDEQSLRDSIAIQYRYLEEIGLNELASGNVSCRLGDDEMLISPSGATAQNITPQNIVRTSLNGDWEGDYKPSSEWQMHAGVYQQTDAMAVVHTHSDHCVALSCQGEGLPGFHYLVGSFGGPDVPCVPYSTFGTAQLATDAAAALQSRSACLLGSHGMISRGSNLDEAVSLAHRLEIMCRQYLLAKQLGEPYLLSQKEWDEFFEQMEKLAYGELR